MIELWKSNKEELDKLTLKENSLHMQNKLFSEQTSKSQSQRGSDLNQLFTARPDLAFARKVCGTPHAVTERTYGG